jgi:hypothetical protein
MLLRLSKSRGNTNNNYQMIQHQFLDLKAKFLAEWAKKEAAAGVEDFGDDDPVAQLMEDLLEEVKDFEAERLKWQMTRRTRRLLWWLVARYCVKKQRTKFLLVKQ